MKYTYLINFIIFLGKIILFFITKSYALLISSLYNLAIGIAKLKTNSFKVKEVSICVIIASILFIIYSIWIIITNKQVHYDLYTSLLIATITFYDIIYSIYGIIKYKTKQYKLMKQVSLATSLISLQLTQSAILSFTTVTDNSFYNGLIGILAGISALIIGIIINHK